MQVAEQRIQPAEAQASAESAGRPAALDLFSADIGAASESAEGLIAYSRYPTCANTGPWYAHQRWPDGGWGSDLWGKPR
ncbi:hypothetical protein KCP69_12145 [Salmonella enterica subsp. enterica]|nr:hypothetical protein KCP69_12145 [Salmonella enterica subsp. enterica]